MKSKTSAAQRSAAKHTAEIASGCDADCVVSLAAATSQQQWLRQRRRRRLSLAVYLVSVVNAAWNWRLKLHRVYCYQQVLCCSSPLLSPSHSCVHSDTRSVSACLHYGANDQNTFIKVPKVKILLRHCVKYTLILAVKYHAFNRTMLCYDNGRQTCTVIDLLHRTKNSSLLNCWKFYKMEVFHCRLKMQ